MRNIRIVEQAVEPHTTGAADRNHLVIAGVMRAASPQPMTVTASARRPHTEQPPAGAHPRPGRRCMAGTSLQLAQASMSPAAACFVHDSLDASAATAVWPAALQAVGVSPLPGMPLSGSQASHWMNDCRPSGQVP